MRLLRRSRHGDSDPRWRAPSGTSIAPPGCVVALQARIPDTRPRERLAARGASSLSDGELLAVLLGAGTAGRNALELAEALLSRIGGLRELADASELELCCERGVGPARVGLIRAALELGRRAV